MFSHLNYAMVMVSDMSRSVAFYRDKLGLSVKMESPEWSEFQTGTTTLALHSGGKLGESGYADRSSQAGTCTIGFTVEDVQRAYEELRALGIRFVMPPTQREGERIKLAVCLDPDGLSISIVEMVHQWA
jgi:catechol 2,3-dioxygenase-like lactoylglutathione lyase family enzyme